MNSFGDETKFDDNGDPIAMYDLVTWQLTPNGEIDFVTIGKFDETTTAGEQKLKIQEQNIVWNGNQTEVGISIVSNSFLQVASSVITYSLCDFVATNAVCISCFGQVPLSVCSSICPQGTRRAIRPHFPICCHDCVVCTAGEISNYTGEETTHIMFINLTLQW